MAAQPELDHAAIHLSGSAGEAVRRIEGGVPAVKLGKPGDVSAVVLRVMHEGAGLDGLY